MGDEVILERLQLEVEALAEKATRMEEAAKQARRDYQEMQSLLNSRRNDIDSRLLRLPNELILAIINYMVDLDVHGHSLTSRAASWVVSQISRRFRQLALSTPSLWAVIRVRTSWFQWCRSRDPSEMLNIWLERSMPLPISCLIHLEGEERLAETENQILTILMAHASRWLHLDIDFGTRVDLYCRLAASENPLSQLQSVRLSLTVDEGDYDDFCDNMPGFNAGAFSDAPELREASISVHMDLENDPYEDQWVLLSMPWGRLRELVLLVDMVEEFFGIAPLLTHMTYCRLVSYEEGYYSAMEQLSYLTLGPRHSDPKEPIFLPSLQRLELTGGIGRMIRLLRHLYAPNLTELLIDPECVSEGALEILAGAIAEFLRRSASSVQVLLAPIGLLQLPVFTEVDFAQLNELHVLVNNGRFSPHVEPIVQSISSLQSPSFFPGLQTIHLISSHLRNRKVLAAIADVVEKRRHELKRFGLDIDQESSSHGDKAQGIDTDLLSFKRLIGMERNGLELLGRRVDGRWRPVHENTTCWDARRYDRLMERFRFSWWVRNRFGKYWT